MKRPLLCAALATLFAAAVYGANPAPPSGGPVDAAAETPAILQPRPQPFPADKAPDAGAEVDFPVFRTLGGLGIVVFLMAGGYFAARKFAPRFFSRLPADRTLRVIETLPMGDKRSISVIEIGKSRFLVGNTSGQINLLMSLPDTASPEPESDALAVPDKSASKKEVAIPFRSLFEVEKRRRPPRPLNPLPEDIRTKMRQLREALER